VTRLSITRARALAPALSLAVVILCLGAAAPASAQQLLVPMDRGQSNHLRAYGLTFWVLERGDQAEWLLNYRGGSFLLPDGEAVRAEAAIRGVRVEPLDGAAEARLRARMLEGDGEAVPLEKAPKIAVYTPPNSTPWDDAVTMALEYAGIPYGTIWDREVLSDGLAEYDWVHLHHEDFTGQYSKFFLTYAGSDWLREEVARNTEMATQLGYASVPAMKRAVSETIRSYVEGGGFLFAMCSATETLELALAAGPVDIAAAFADGSPPDPQANRRIDWAGSMAFEGAEVQISPTVNAFSDIDSHQVNTPWRKELGVYTLFEFSAEFDPVPAMLTQNHEGVLEDFYGLTTGFEERLLKPGVVVLAREGSWAKYIHGTFGEGTFTYFGGHDPEDPEHQIGDPPTDLDLHPNSPGYRLILNNVLFPAAKKKKLKT
jgi:hypothetical protein